MLLIYYRHIHVEKFIIKILFASKQNARLLEWGLSVVNEVLFYEDGPERVLIVHMFARFKTNVLE